MTTSERYLRSEAAFQPQQFVMANGIRFHYVELGSGPLVLLLHGFPEFWWGWRRQLGPLADAGLRVVAPDLRGYNLTERPPSGYDLDTLTADIAGLVNALGQARCYLVGHDWGGVVAWVTAMRYPGLVEKLAILNAAHPATYAREVRRPEQLAKSWYFLLFGIPRLPEWLLSRRRCQGIVDIFKRSSTRSSTFSDDELEIYREVWCQPGAIPAALAYYRAALRSLRLGPHGFRGRLPQIGAETLVLWGMRDVAQSPRLLNGLERWVPNLQVQRVPDVGHWIQHEAPDEVNSRLSKHLA